MISWFPSFRFIGWLVFVVFFSVWGISSVQAGPELLIVSESGEKSRGELNSIREGSLIFSRGSFRLEYSLEALKFIQFYDLEEPEKFRNQSVLILRDGTVFPFRRILRTTQEGVEVVVKDGTKKEVPYKKLKSIHFGEAVKQFTILYREKNGDSISITYRPESSVFRSGRVRWEAKKEEGVFRCSLISSHGIPADTQPMMLWKLPPESGGQWTLHEGRGTGQWLNESSDTSTSKSFSSRTFPFRFDLPGPDQRRTIEGEFSARLLLPVQFTIQKEQLRKWTLERRPKVMTFEPCFLYRFLLNQDFFTKKSNYDTAT